MKIIYIVTCLKVEKPKNKDLDINFILIVNETKKKFIKLLIPIYFSKSLILVI